MHVPAHRSKLPAWTRHPLRRDASTAAPTAAPTPWTNAPLRRYFDLDLRTLDEKERTIEVAFSSETPVLRWGDYEVLSHASGACDLSRLNAGGIVLFNHDRDQYIGVVAEGSARIESDRKGRARLRFAAGEKADRTLADIKAGILRQVSIGYLVLEWSRQHAVDQNGPDTYTAVRWQPYEISIVTVAADPSVGVGRAHPVTQHTDQNTMNRAQTIAALQARGIAFDASATDEQLRELLARSPDEGARSQPPASQPPAPAATPPAPDAARSATVTTTVNTTVTDILNLADTYSRAVPTAHELAREAIRQGHDVMRFQRTLLDSLNGNTERGLNESTTIGMGDKEIKNFSFARFLLAASAQPGDKRSLEAAAFELEVAQEAARKMGASGREVRGLVIPADVLQRAGRRDIISIKDGAGYTGTGGNVVENHLLMGSFMQMLHNLCVFIQRCTPLTGLQGTISIPKQTSAASAGWIGEDDDAPNTAITLGQLQLAHKTVAAYSQVTRDMLKQPSMDIEAFVRWELARASAAAIDTAGYYGSGANGEPLGVKNVSGISAHAFTGGKPDYAGIVAMETAIAAANADIGSMAYILNAVTRGKLKTTKRFADTGTDAVLWEPGNTVNGYATAITNQVQPDDMFFGVWSEIIYAMWGGLEILADQNVKNGRIMVSAFQDVNFLCRRPECFCFGDLSVTTP